MMAFRNGDFAVRLPTDWEGIEGRIAEAFNQALAHEDRITREITRLGTAVGKEGRLRQRISVPGAIGGWAEKVKDIERSRAAGFNRHFAKPVDFDVLVRSLAQG